MKVILIPFGCQATSNTFRFSYLMGWALCLELEIPVLLLGPLRLLAMEIINHSDVCLLHTQHCCKHPLLCTSLVT